MIGKKRFLFGIVFVFVIINIVGVIALSDTCRRGVWTPDGSTTDSSWYCFPIDPGSCEGASECGRNVCDDYGISWPDECMRDVSWTDDYSNDGDVTQGQTEKVHIYSNFRACPVDEQTGRTETESNIRTDIFSVWNPALSKYRWVGGTATSTCCAVEETPCEIIRQAGQYPPNPSYSVLHSEEVCCAGPTPSCTPVYYWDNLTMQCTSKRSTEFIDGSDNYLSGSGSYLTTWDIEPVRKCSVCSGRGDSSIVSDSCAAASKDTCCYGSDCYDSETSRCYGDECLPLICLKEETAYDSDEDGRLDSCCGNRDVSMVNFPPNYGRSNIVDVDATGIDEACCDSNDYLPADEYLVKNGQTESTALNPNGYACVPFIVDRFEIDWQNSGSSGWFHYQKEFCAECTGSGDSSIVSDSCESDGKVDCLYNQCYNDETEIVCGNKCSPVGEENKTGGLDGDVANCCDVDGKSWNGAEVICNGAAPYCAPKVEKIMELEPNGGFNCGVFTNLEDEEYFTGASTGPDNRVNCRDFGCTWAPIAGSGPSIPFNPMQNFGACNGADKLCSDVDLSSTGTMTSEEYCTLVGCSYNATLNVCEKLVENCVDIQENICVACTADSHCNPTGQPSNEWTKSCCSGESGQAKCIDKATEVCCGASGCGRVHDRADWPVEVNGKCFREEGEARIISADASPKPELWLSGPHDEYNEIGTNVAKDIFDSYMSQAPDGDLIGDFQGTWTNPFIVDFTTTFNKQPMTVTYHGTSSSVKVSSTLAIQDGLGLTAGVMINRQIRPKDTNVMVSPGGTETVVIGQETYYEIVSYETRVDRNGNIHVIPIYGEFTRDLTETITTPPIFNGYDVDGVEYGVSPMVGIGLYAGNWTATFDYGQDLNHGCEDSWSAGLSSNDLTLYVEELAGSDLTAGFRWDAMPTITEFCRKWFGP